MAEIDSRHPEMHLDHEPMGCLLFQPIMKVDAVVAEGGKSNAIVGSCVICGNEHRHSFDTGIRSLSAGSQGHLSIPSHRAAHCGHDAPPDAPGGYWLMYTSGTEGIEYDEELGSFKLI